MPRQNQLGSLFALAAVLTLGACETINTPGYRSGYDNNYPQTTHSRGNYVIYGVVESV